MLHPPTSAYRFAPSARRTLSRQLVSMAVLVSMVLSLLLAIAPAAVAAPAAPAIQAQPAPAEQDPAPTAEPDDGPDSGPVYEGATTDPAAVDAMLNLVNVAAPNINCFFDTDCVITVSDMASHFLPPGAIGDAFLQSRTWPQGQAGTPGARQYPYLYRVDLRSAIATTAISCVTGMSINFGPIIANDYNGDAKPDHVFVVTAGGLGTIAPKAAVQSGGVVTFRFDPPICPGSHAAGGQSSFFFGMAAPRRERVVPATLNGTGGLNVTLKAKAPRPAPPAAGCYELKSPTEIPAPVLIDFDDQPDAVVLENVYRMSHGVKFYNGADTKVITYADRASDPTKARSTPNVATNNAVHPTTSANLPLSFQFTSGKTHVGFYMGNGEGANLSGAMVGYDRDGNVICQVTNAPVPEKYDEFIGMYDPAGRIARVTLNYGESILSEAIDDLYFAPGGDGPLAAPVAPLFEDGGESVRVAVSKSDNKSFEATFTFPQGQLLPVDGPDQRKYLQFVMPGIDPNTSAEPGLPEVPIYRAMLAAPQGAKLNIAALLPATGDPLTGLLLPAQPSPADQDTADQGGDVGIIEGDLMDKPFTRNDEAYRSEGPFPAQPVSVVFMGAVRDLDLWQISIAGGAYNPAKGELLPYKSVQVSFSFEGGAGGFLPKAREGNAFDGNGNPLSDGGDGLNPLYASALNANVLRTHLYEGPLLTGAICWGSEFLIITDPAFRPAADTLRAWKIAKGISTAVVETGGDPNDAGTTNTAIRAFIKKRYDTCLVRPSYVLLLGDAEHIPPFYRSTVYGDLGGTDLDYSLMTGADTLPDLAYGRIPVDTLASANIVVNKIVAYEDNPPFAPAFYDNVTVASYFQCCRADVANDGTDSRSFLETSELIRSHLSGAGYNVQRIYHTDDDYHDDPAKPGYYNAATRSTVPNRYFNGALLPATLRAGSGYPWNGSGADVVNAINAGRFLILHRDHGGINGWGDPSFGTGNLASLTNGALTPVVYSINCASGLWDNETRNPANDAYTYNTNVGGAYWAESILRQNGGAVGVIGDTRNSPTWANSALARGLIDATWPTLLPFGGAGSIRRLGDILNHGKLYMLGQVGVAQTAGSVSSGEANTNNVLYHVLGDPTLTMWKSNPYWIILPEYVTVHKFLPKFWTLKYPVEGAVLTALQGDTPIARGVVINGLAELQLLGDGSVFDPKQALDLSAQLPDGQSAKLALRTKVAGYDPNQGGGVQDDGVNFTLPAGAWNAPLSIVYQRELTPAVPLLGGDLGLDFVELDAFDGAGNEVNSFARPWSLEFSYADGELGGKSEDGLQCRTFNEQTGLWEPIQTSVDKAANKVLCAANHFSQFALVAGEPFAPSSFIYLPMVKK